MYHGQHLEDAGAADVAGAAAFEAAFASLDVHFLARRHGETEGGGFVGGEEALGDAVRKAWSTRDTSRTVRRRCRRSEGGGSLRSGPSRA